METKRWHISKSGALEAQFVNPDVLEAYDALALEAIGECRKSIMMACRFLNAALWHAPLERAPLASALAVGPRALRYDPERVLGRYREGEELVRDCLHAVLHSVFHHPFDRRHSDFDAWALACDISVEACALEIAGERFASADDDKRREEIAWLRGLARTLTAASLYQTLRSGGPGERLYESHGITSADIERLRRLFARDSHVLWAGFPHEEEGRELAKGAQALPDLQAGDSSGAEQQEAGRASAGEGAAAASSANGSVDDDGGVSESDTPDGPSEPDVSEGGGEPDSADAMAGDGADAAPDDRKRPSADEPDDDAQAAEEWRRISKRVEAEMRAWRGGGMLGDGSMLASLTVANKKAADYDEFLKRFATLAEDLRVNDDEFDYIYYTYGMQRYGNVPLVEPLEYVERSRVREFVIALDTSGSCSGHLIREFVERTYSILRQRTSFGDAINVHIVQCDNRLRTATKVTSLRQLEEYSDSFWVSGGGGTDFKPVFAYVDQLIEQGEFDDLRGLIYFTDGYGSFPVRAPDYDVAFVFVNVEGLDVRVPPWAMKVIMTQDEILHDGN